MLYWHYEDNVTLEYSDRHSRASNLSSFPRKQPIVIPAQATYRHSRESNLSSFPRKQPIVIPAKATYRHSRASGNPLAC
jgi:hypothetical protein